MKERFDERGYHFDGNAPTAKEIRELRKQKERADELEGIDESLIITGKRSRSGLAPNYTVDFGDSGADDDDAAAEEAPVATKSKITEKIDDDDEAEFI